MNDEAIDISYLETHFPLNNALLCVDCNTVFQDKLGRCPCCTAASSIALATVLDSVAA